MMENFKYLIFFLEYLILPLLTIYFALFIKSKLNEEQTLYVLLEDIDIDFRIITSLGICLFGLSLIGHNEYDVEAYNYYGIGGVMASLCFICLLFLKVINHKRKVPTISNQFFGFSSSAIYRPACFQIYFLYAYVVAGLVLKKLHHGSDAKDLIWFVILLVAFTGLFFVFGNGVLNNLVIKLLNNQGVYSFNNLYNASPDTREEQQSQKAIKVQLAEVSHLLANKKLKDPSTVPLLQNLSELYELQNEPGKAIACIDRVIALYEDKNINLEPNNVLDACLYKIELLERTDAPQHALNAVIQYLKTNYPNNKRVAALKSV